MFGTKEDGILSGVISYSSLSTVSILRVCLSSLFFFFLASHIDFMPTGYLSLFFSFLYIYSIYNVFLPFFAFSFLP